jgi:glutamine synthetase
MSDILTESVQGRFTDLKIAQADRCPKSLGTLIKKEEVQFHHEVTNQFLWSKF